MRSSCTAASAEVIEAAIARGGPAHRQLRLPDAATASQHARTCSLGTTGAPGPPTLASTRANLEECQTSTTSAACVYRGHGTKRASIHILQTVPKHNMCIEGYTGTYDLRPTPIFIRATASFVASARS